MSQIEHEAVNNDELTAFVTATLRAIAAGVSEAGVSVQSDRRDGHHSFDIPHKVSFDIGVAATRTSEGSGGLKVQVFSVGAGIDGKRIAKSETVSRIVFDVLWTFKSSSPISVPSSKTALNNR